MSRRRKLLLPTGAAPSDHGGSRPRNVALSDLSGLHQVLLRLLDRAATEKPQLHHWRALEVERLYRILESFVPTHSSSYLALLAPFKEQG